MLKLLVFFLVIAYMVKLIHCSPTKESVSEETHTNHTQTALSNLAKDDNKSKSHEKKYIKKKSEKINNKKQHDRETTAEKVKKKEEKTLRTNVANVTKSNDKDDRETGVSKLPTLRNGSHVASSEVKLPFPLVTIDEITHNKTAQLIQMVKQMPVIPHVVKVVRPLQVKNTRREYQPSNEDGANENVRRYMISNYDVIESYIKSRRGENPFPLTTEDPEVSIRRKRFPRKNNGDNYFQNDERSKYLKEGDVEDAAKVNYEEKSEEAVPVTPQRNIWNYDHEDWVVTKKLNWDYQQRSENESSNEQSAQTPKNGQNTLVDSKQEEDTPNESNKVKKVKKSDSWSGKNIVGKNEEHLEATNTGNSKKDVNNNERGINRKHPNQDRNYDQLDEPNTESSIKKQHSKEHLNQERNYDQSDEPNTESSIKKQHSKESKQNIERLTHDKIRKLNPQNNNQERVESEYNDRSEEEKFVSETLDKQDTPDSYPVHLTSDSIDAPASVMPKKLRRPENSIRLNKPEGSGVPPKISDREAPDIPETPEKPEVKEKLEVPEMSDKPAGHERPEMKLERHEDLNTSDSFQKSNKRNERLKKNNTQINPSLPVGRFRSDEIQSRSSKQKDTDTSDMPWNHEKFDKPQRNDDYQDYNLKKNSKNEMNAADKYKQLKREYNHNDYEYDYGEKNRKNPKQEYEKDNLQNQKDKNFGEDYQRDKKDNYNSNKREPGKQTFDYDKKRIPMEVDMKSRERGDRDRVNQYKEKPKRFDDYGLKETEISSKKVSKWSHTHNEDNEQQNGNIGHNLNWKDDSREGNKGLKKKSNDKIQTKEREREQDNKWQADYNSKKGGVGAVFWDRDANNNWDKVGVDNARRPTTENEDRKSRTVKDYDEGRTKRTVKDYDYGRTSRKVKDYDYDRTSRKIKDYDYDRTSRKAKDYDYDKTNRKVKDYDYDRTSRKIKDYDYDRTSRKIKDYDYDRTSRKSKDYDYDKTNRKVKDYDYDRTSRKTKDYDYDRTSRKIKDYDYGRTSRKVKDYDYDRTSHKVKDYDYDRTKRTKKDYEDTTQRTFKDYENERRDKTTTKRKPTLWDTHNNNWDRVGRPSGYRERKPYGKRGKGQNRNPGKNMQRFGHTPLQFLHKSIYEEK